MTVERNRYILNFITNLTYKLLILARNNWSIRYSISWVLPLFRTTKSLTLKILFYVCNMFFENRFLKILNVTCDILKLYLYDSWQLSIDRRIGRSIVIVGVCITNVCETRRWSTWTVMDSRLLFVR